MAALVLMKNNCVYTFHRGVVLIGGSSVNPSLAQALCALSLAPVKCRGLANKRQSRLCIQAVT